MDRARWRLVEAIYHEAAARPPGDRDAYLAQACGGDASVLAEVRSLLDHDRSEAPWLAGPRPVPLPADEPLRAGQRVGDYEVRGLLGAGGMGQVYRAYDIRLGREVAIKVLPQPFGDDRQRVSRFEREARLLASLNHPNIAAIYGMEEATAANGRPVPSLVLELVEGETLAERIGRGPLRLAETTKIAVQIADALDAAHDRGIVHRDLKPANIKVTPEGTVKVLDFGVATAVGHPHDAVTGAPTDGDRTEPGSLLGTASYMSPEQARGQTVDRRADVWSFGCVLFEMLTGVRAFGGATVADTLAAVLEREPDWTALPGDTPPAMRRVLRWALAKEPERRLRALGDARLELEAAEPPAAAAARAPRSRGIAAAVLLATAVLGVTAGIVASRWGQQQPARSASAFTIAVGERETLARNVAISPDGQYVAYLGGPPGNMKTYFRRLGERDARVIAEMPLQSPAPFFSPDSQWLAFFDAGKLKKLPLAGGTAITLAEAPTPRGGTWAADGTIVFAPISRGALMWMPAEGGTPQALTTLDEARHETSHRLPSFLPQSRTVLFMAESTGPADTALSLRAVSLDTKAVVTVSQGQARLAQYVPTGHLAFLAAGRLMVAPFDAAALRTTAPAVPLLADVDSFSFSDEGTLVYSETPPYNVNISTLVWVARDGSVTPLPLPPATYTHPRLSPDGQLIAVHQNSDGNLHVYDIVRERLTRLTFSAQSDWPVWGPRGQIYYGSNRAGTQWDIVSIPADGSGQERNVLVAPLTQIPRALSPAGDTLVFEETYADRPNTLLRMALAGGEPRPLLPVAAGEMMPAYSPDGRWIAYVASQSSRYEIVVRASSGQGRTWQVSNDGGVEPLWSRDGRELFYRSGDRMMAVDVTPADSPTFGRPRVLFEGSYMFGPTEGQYYDVTRDGRRFLMLKPQQVPAVTPLKVVINWFDDLRRRSTVPAD